MIRARAPGTRAPPPPPLLLSLSLLLLLLSPTVGGDCGPPPDIPNATPNSGRHTKFAKQAQVTYSCNKGFKQIPDKSNTVVCLDTGEWSTYEPFCNKTCNAPMRLASASLKKEYRNMNFFPIGTTVEFECRPGFQKVPSLSGKSICLEELAWSPVADFCKKRACPNPGELRNGHINISTDLLFGSEIVFSCNRGYRLVGVTSTFCSVTGNTVDWDDVFPVCTTTLCPDPPKIHNGEIREESDSYAYRHSVTYTCAKGFVLVGNSTIYCALKGEEGVWSSPPPKCVERKKVPTKTPSAVDVSSTPHHLFTLINFPSTGVPPVSPHPTVKGPGTRVLPTPQKPTRVEVPGTRVPPTSQKHTTVNVPSTRVLATPQKPSMVHVSDTRVSPKPQKPTKANNSSTAAPLTPQKTNTTIIPATETPPVPQKTNTTIVPATEIPPVPQKTNTTIFPATEIPPTPQKTNKAIVPATETPPAPQKTNTDVPATETPPAPQKTNTIIPATEIPPTPQKTNTTIIPATEIPPTPQKTNTTIIPATETLPVPQKTNTAIVPATETPPAPQKTNTAIVPATEIPSTPQKTNKAIVPATEIPPTPQKTNTTIIPATETPPVPQKTNTAIVPTTEILPTPQKANTDVPATEIPPTPQKANTADVPAAEMPPTPQKANTAKVSAIKPATAQMPLISTTVFAQTSPITQHPTTVNSSAVQTVQTTQGFATAKPSLTQNPPATQRPTISHFSMTKGLHTVTQRFTSAHITATEHVPVIKTTVRHPTRTSKERGESNSGGDHFIYGKFGPQGVKRNCHHCGNHSPYFWKRIFSYNCLRKTIKMQCLWVPKGRRVKPFNRLVSWTPLGIQYGPSFSQPCSCSKAVLGQLRVIWPISQVALSARCVSVSF